MLTTSQLGALHEMYHRQDDQRRAPRPPWRQYRTLAALLGQGYLENLPASPYWLLTDKALETGKRLHWVLASSEPEG